MIGKGREKEEFGAARIKKKEFFVCFLFLNQFDLVSKIDVGVSCVFIPLIYHPQREKKSGIAPLGSPPKKTKRSFQGFNVKVV